MAITKVEAVEYVCDGCGTFRMGVKDDPVVGITIGWHEVGTGGESGSLWVCKERCVTKAFKRRYDIERAKAGKP